MMSCRYRCATHIHVATRLLGLIAFCALLQLNATCLACQQPAERHSELNDKYEIQDDILIDTRDGEQVAVIVVHKKGNTARLPTTLQFSVYVRVESDTKSLMETVDRGYVAVTAYTRGKHRSPGKIVPYECDGRDAYKDVSDESIKDAKAPLTIKWWNTSVVRIPVSTKRQAGRGSAPD